MNIYVCILYTHIYNIHTYPHVCVHIYIILRIIGDSFHFVHVDI